MNFKIESNSLNLTNYPIIAKHFEAMASKGWLIDKIVFDSWCVYKKIKPEELDFSISPYEVERTFTRSSKEELNEFRGACKEAGWNYAAKSNDFHIYFKEKGSDAEDLETDEEEEFNTLEKIAHKHIRNNLIMISLFAFMILYVVKLSYIDIHIIQPRIGLAFMKSLLSQLLALVFPIFFISSSVYIYKIYKFIKINKENIEIGKSIEYNQAKNILDRILNYAILIMIIVTLLDIGYGVLSGGNPTISTFIIPYISIFLIVGFYRFFIKPSKKSYDFKAITLFATFILALAVALILSRSKIGSSQNEGTLNISGLKVITADDLNSKESNHPAELKKDFSLIIPESYEYRDFTEEGYILTEYTRSLNDFIGGYVVKQYIKPGKNQAITKGDKEVWNADEAYFLDRESKSIVIRKGKEVWKLEGIDFSDSDNIEIVKVKLGL